MAGLFRKAFLVGLSTKGGGGAGYTRGGLIGGLFLALNMNSSFFKDDKCTIKYR